MVCESEPDAPWGLLIMTSVREAQTDRRRDVKGSSGSSGVFQLAMLYPTHCLLDLMREEMMLY